MATSPTELFTEPPASTEGHDEIGQAMEPAARLVMGVAADGSGSMRGAKHAQLVSTFNGWVGEVRSMPAVAGALDLAVARFGNGGVETLDLGPAATLPGMASGAPFAFARDARLPAFECAGDTPLGAGVEHVIELVRSRRRAVAQGASVGTYRPTVVVLSDGLPTDDWKAALPRIRDLESAKRLLLYCIGVDGADFGVLREIAPNATYDCNVRFDKLAAMLSASAGSGASSGDTKDVYDTVASALAGLGVERR